MTCLPPLWRRAACALAALLAATPSQADDPAWHGVLRTYWQGGRAANAGPLAAADAAGLAISPPSTLNSEAQLQGALTLGGAQLRVEALARQRRRSGEGEQGRMQFNEAQLSGGSGPWQWTVGKKVLSWDVGQGFRPNDLVQQETRRSLLNLPLEGRSMLLGEYFSAERAWSLAAVNPTARRSATGGSEPALAARVYQRDGDADWHGFARLGAHTGASVGAAAAWVVNESLELHASARYLRHHDTLRHSADSPPLSASNPWLNQRQGSARQWLIGGSWTTAEQISLLLEAWRDGAAPSAADWRGWAARNAELSRYAAAGAPAMAVAGNQAGQAQMFPTSGNLRRDSLFARLSWTHDGWQPTLDALYHPQDGGLMLTAALSWQGDRLKLETGLRRHAGPASALIRQLPQRSQAYAWLEWAY